MSGIAQIGTDLKKFIDTTFYAYLPKVKKLRTLFRENQVDPTQVTTEYFKMTQTYAEATGYTGLGTTAPLLADGSSPELASFGTEDATSTQVSRGLGFKIDRKLLNSSLPFQKEYVVRHSLELLNAIENQVNTTLNTNMNSNAGQSYTATGGTWATTGDPVQDINDAKNSFKKRSGGIAANSIALHPDDLTQLENDFRFQNTLYSATSNVLDGGKLTPNPMGLEWIDDTAVTKGTFLMCARGMFGTMQVSENYKVYPKDLGVVGQRYDAVFTWVDQYELPFYLMEGSGI